MGESRTVPSGDVYRQLFDAQARLSRSLLAGPRVLRTASLSLVDSRTPDSSRVCSSTSRGQQRDDEDAEEDGSADVIRLPDSVVVHHPGSGIIEKLRKRRGQRHDEAVRQLESEMIHLSQVCEVEVRTICEEVLSSLREVDLRLEVLKARSGQQEPISLQAFQGLWQEVEEEGRQKKIRISELDKKLSDCEKRRSLQIKAALRKHCHLLEQISFLSPPDVHRLLHHQAMMLNQSLLANRRSIARLVLLLQEENLQQEALLRLHWEDRLDRWRSSRVEEVVERLRSLCSSRDEEPELMLDQNLKQTQEDLKKQRCDVIYKICSLAPPTGSLDLVSDWFEELTAVNQQIDALHADLLQQLRGFYEHTWQRHLTEVESCKEALSALQLTDQQVEEIVASQLLPLIGQRQGQDEERLAALDVCSDSLGCHALQVSGSVFEVMRASALLWETHCCRSERREEELKRQLEVPRKSHQQHVQKMMLQVDVLMGALRQESSEDALKACLDKTVGQLQKMEDSCRQSVRAQWELLDQLPALLMEDLLSYSSSIASFFRLSPAYRPSPADQQDLPASSIRTSRLVLEAPSRTETLQPEQNRPISSQSRTAHTQKWLTEGASSLLRLCDISSSVAFTSTGGVAYTGPAFSRCPAPDLPDSVQPETHLSLFPAELLMHTLSRTRVLVLDHVEQSFKQLLGSAAAMVTERKKAVRLEQELQLKPEHIRTHVYEPRLAELQRHQQVVDNHCQDLSDVVTSCRKEFQDLQTSVQRKNLQLFDVLSSCRTELMELQTSIQKNQDGLQVALSSSRRLETFGSSLQERLDQHDRDTRSCLSSFKRAVRSRLEEARRRTSELLKSFRMFSEGGDFAPQEVKMFQRRLTEETQRISATEESIYSELELFESKSLQQVRKAAAPLKEKLSSLQAEVKFTDEVQKILSRTQIQIKAEAASSNQQQSELSSRLEDLRRTTENLQVAPDQICSFFSSTNEELKTRCRYLDCDLGSVVQEILALSAPPGSRTQLRRTGVDLHEEPAVGAVRFSSVLDSKNQNRGRKAADPSSTQRQQRSADSISTSSLRRSSRSIRAENNTDITTKRKFQIFGPKQEVELSSHSLGSCLTSILWRTNNVLLQLAENFYCSKHLCSINLLPESADQWAVSMQQRLLGYQEQGKSFLSASKDELLKQVSVFRELLGRLPDVSVQNHEGRHRLQLTQEVATVRRKLEEELAASEEEKSANVRQLRVSLTEDELQALNSREELRQQRAHSAILSAHLELQACVRGRAQEFVTSLSSLTEKLLRLLDQLLTAAETEPAEPPRAVTMKTGAETGSRLSRGSRLNRGSRTWPGITYLFPPTDDSADSPVLMTSPSMTTARSSLRHEAVIEHRDAALKGLDQLIRSEASRSDLDKRNQLSEQQSWSSHWRQQIVALRRIRRTEDVTLSGSS
ncbi:coiled-coil domain-containing protein 180-like isoform X1 [Fundulus heteroclitus]|uniref:coiled-coil domain-containing protein 180-like isoform X1 n=2 Tax=Fundulus heteroclitus TaxID=8078 RepID=UPI00165C7277|nr:coiled-coil domain-containing protein 180-like isoform X1 [Fundulus heteroclitus]